MFRKAKEYADAAGFTARAVPLKTLAPLLEGASLEDEDDEDMASRWASLLANASRPGSVVPPSFPDILSHLTSLEARLLDAVYESAQGHTRDDWLTQGVQVIGNASALGASAEQARVAAENLIRLRLCSFPATSFDFTDHPYRQFLIASGEDILCLTPLGAAFVEACRQPLGSSN